MEYQTTSKIPCIQKPNKKKRKEKPDKIPEKPKGNHKPKPNKLANKCRNNVPEVHRMPDDVHVVRLLGHVHRMVDGVRRDVGILVRCRRAAEAALQRCDVLIDGCCTVGGILGPKSIV